MTLSPARAWSPIPMVSNFGPWGLMGATSASTPASAVWESADRGIYLAISIPVTCVAQRMWWANGGTVSASYNVDAGIYADAGYKPGAKLITTGSTAQGTASQVQFADITDTVLTPGRYWLAMSCSSASATFLRIGNVLSDSQHIKLQQASALPLPATATPAEAASGNIPLFGFSTTTIT